MAQSGSGPAGMKVIATGLRFPEGPIAMGYVAVEYAKPGTRLHLIVRGKALEADVVAMPFVSQRYYRGSK